MVSRGDGPRSQSDPEASVRGLRQGSVEDLAGDYREVKRTTDVTMKIRLIWDDAEEGLNEPQDWLWDEIIEGGTDNVKASVLETSQQEVE